MVICKEHCAAGTSVPASIATQQMTIFHLTNANRVFPICAFLMPNFGKQKLGGAAKMTDCCVDASRGTDVPRRHISWHSVILAASRHYP